MLKRLLGSLILLLLLSACNSGPSANVTTGFSKLYGDIGTETAYCSTVSVPATPTTITLTTPAVYSYYVASSLGLATSSSRPIRRAEVQILDSTGTAIQCGETSDTGTISIDIPRTAGNYTLKVLSRAFSSVTKTSILNNPTAMLPYSVSVSFSLTGSEPTKTVTLATAALNGTLEGGAFNILDQIYNANAYIKDQTNASCSAPLCGTFTSANKSRIFWTPGLSPAAYYGTPTATTSFYIASDDSSLGMATGIYLLGGVNGSVCSDTDHFDNSVIIHEYGHFLEKDQAYSDSPGGSHTGNGLIDPRLAWSEGWANFFQGAVRSDTRYIDTIGNVACSTSTYAAIYASLETAQSGNDLMSGGTYSGEGIFREFSVSRVLWDAMNGPGTDTFGASLGFKFIWKAFSDTTSGLASTSSHFRNVGLFNELLSALVNAGGNVNATAQQQTDYSSLVANEYQLVNRKEYANPVALTTPGACTKSMTVVAGVSNLAKTSDFFQYYYDGTSAHATVTLRYTSTASSDLDLYVYKENHVLGGSTEDGLVGAGYTIPSNPLAGSDSVSLAGQLPGYYMILIDADVTAGSSTITYYLETNSGSDRLCPQF